MVVIPSVLVSSGSHIGHVEETLFFFVGLPVRVQT